MTTSATIARQWCELLAARGVDTCVAAIRQSVVTATDAEIEPLKRAFRLFCSGVLCEPQRVRALILALDEAPPAVDPEALGQSEQLRVLVEEREVLAKRRAEHIAALDPSAVSTEAEIRALRQALEDLHRTIGMLERELDSLREGDHGS